MKHLIFVLLTAAFMTSPVALAAKRKPTQITKTEKVGLAKSKKKKKTKKKIAKKWNNACQGLLDNSVKSTLRLERSVQKKKKIAHDELENKIQDELMVVQLNAWVCAISTTEKEKSASSVEERFFQDYSKQVQSKRL